jgi:hypothetical protein
VGSSVEVPPGHRSYVCHCGELHNLKASVLSCVHFNVQIMNIFSGTQLQQPQLAIPARPCLTGCSNVAVVPIQQSKRYFWSTVDDLMDQFARCRALCLTLTNKSAAVGQFTASFPSSCDQARVTDYVSPFATLSNYYLI